MRISSQMIFQRGLGNILSQQTKTLQLQQQLSSGKRVNVPSDDPVAAAKIDQIRQKINSTENLQSNKEAAQSALRYEENILSNTVNAVQRIRELQVQAGNNAMSEQDRKSLAVEVKVLLEEITNLANAQDSSGSFLFSGSKTGIQAFTRNSAGDYIYNGDDTQRFHPISNGLTTAVNDNGADVFMRIPSGNGRFAINQTLTPNQGNVVISTGNVVDNAAYVADHYTLQFALNTANQMVVMISGVDGGNVLPASGDVDDAPLYQSGSGITFNGIQVNMTGEPVAGDAYEITPSTNQSLFITIERMIDNLHKSPRTAADSAAIEMENNQLLLQLDSGLNNVLSYQSQIGARMNQIEVAEQINTDLIETGNITLSQLEEVDLSETVVKLNLQMIYLQAAQQSFTKIQGLSVFNYLS